MSKKKIIASISVARSDFDRLSNFYEKLDQSKKYRIELAVGAGHNNHSLGKTIKSVNSSNLTISKKIRYSKKYSKQSSLIIEDLSSWFSVIKPDAFLILGDRYEMLAAAHTAVLNNIPIIHIGGGHVTQGAIDDKIRNAITKLSSIHFVASKKCAKRVIAMGEKKDKVFITGAPEIDMILRTKLIKKDIFFKKYKLNKKRKLILATIHPETTEDKKTNISYADVLEKYLESLESQVIITAPCADPHHEVFIKMCKTLSKNNKNIIYIPYLGIQSYISAMKYSTCVFGNSSSGIIEAASFNTPVINIGSRQKNRDRAINVIDTKIQLTELKKAFATANSKNFRKKCLFSKNPYGEGKFFQKSCLILNKIEWPIKTVK